MQSHDLSWAFFFNADINMTRQAKSLHNACFFLVSMELYHWNIVTLSNSPNGIQSLDRLCPSQLLCLLSDQQLCIVIGHHTGLPNQSLILQVMTCDLLIDAFQTHQEHSMTESKQE